MGTRLLQYAAVGPWLPLCSWSVKQFRNGLPEQEAETISKMLV